MARNKKNISSKISSGKRGELKDFLKENLSGDLFSAMENESGEEFMNDALEGLAEFSSTKNIHRNAANLNRKLLKTTKSKKKTKPFEFGQIFLVIVAIVIIIVLIFLGYTVISMRK